MPFNLFKFSSRGIDKSRIIGSLSFFAANRALNLFRTGEVLEAPSTMKPILLISDWYCRRRIAKLCPTVWDSESFPFQSYICDIICWLSFEAASNCACSSEISFCTRSTLARGLVILQKKVSAPVFASDRQLIHFRLNVAYQGFFFAALILGSSSASRSSASWPVNK